jgi:hypothetical protein
MTTTSPYSRSIWSIEIAAKLARKFCAGRYFDTHIAVLRVENAPLLSCNGPPPGVYNRARSDLRTIGLPIDTVLSADEVGRLSKLPSVCCRPDSGSPETRSNRRPGGNNNAKLAAYYVIVPLA